MVTVPPNVPAGDCAPLTGAERGLLIEETRTNLLLHSEDFTTAWASAGTATVTANATPAPDGALSADKDVDATSNGMHFVSQTVTATVAQNWIATVFVKAAERTTFGLTIYDAANTSNNVNGTFNLASGTAKAYVDMASSPLAVTTMTGGESQVFLTKSVTAPAIHKTAYAWKGNSANFGHNGTVGTEDASCTMPTGLTTVRLGMQGSGVNMLNGHVRQLLLYPPPAFQRRGGTEGGQQPIPASQSR